MTEFLIFGISTGKIIGALNIGVCVTIWWHTSVYNTSGGLVVKVVMSFSSLTLACVK